MLHVLQIITYSHNLTSSVAADRHGMPPPASNSDLWLFDLECLTLKLVCESHLTWGTFLPNLGMLGICLLELFAMFATDGRTDRRTIGRTKATRIASCESRTKFHADKMPRTKWHRTKCHEYELPPSAVSVFLCSCLLCSSLGAMFFCIYLWPMAWVNELKEKEITVYKILINQLIVYVIKIRVRASFDK